MSALFIPPLASRVSIYIDYRPSRRAWKTIKLTAAEFIRRFLHHVLPPEFHKIRHYDLFSNGRAKQQVASIRSMIEHEDPKGTTTAGHEIGRFRRDRQCRARTIA